MKSNFKTKIFTGVIAAAIVIGGGAVWYTNNPKTTNTTEQTAAVAKEQAEVKNEDSITISSTKVEGENVIIEGKSTINPEVSNYIQYYVGKSYEDTLSTCILCDGFNTDKEGNFKLTVPVEKLKGSGNYKLVLEQNSKANKIITPEHWQAIQKTENGISFGDITSMKEISNLALTVGMKITDTDFEIKGDTAANDDIKISSIDVTDESVVLEGKTEIDIQKSNYIQYYIGKLYEGTLTQCILCDGFDVNEDGSFKAEIPLKSLKGDGEYEIVLEQNPKASSILPPKHWQAVTKTENGIAFGDITSMKEISNLAVTVGMQTVSKEFTLGHMKEEQNPLSIIDTKVENDKVIIKGKSTIDPEKSTYIQYYIGKEYENTLSNCIVCDGINTDKEGNFELTLPVEKLKGIGKYKIALEQNPNSDKIITPEHWKAFHKENDEIKFGDISAMGELSNLALTVGMEVVEGEFEIK